MMIFLVIAAAHGRNEMIDYFLSKGATNLDNTLMVAANNGEIDTVRKLLTEEFSPQVLERALDNIEPMRDKQYQTIRTILLQTLNPSNINAGINESVRDTLIYLIDNNNFYRLNQFVRDNYRSFTDRDINVLIDIIRLSFDRLPSNARKEIMEYIDDDRDVDMFLER